MIVVERSSVLSTAESGILDMNTKTAGGSHVEHQGHWKVNGLLLHASPPVKDQFIYENIFKITKIMYEQNTGGAEW